MPKSRKKIGQHPPLRTPVRSNRTGLLRPPPFGDRCSSPAPAQKPPNPPGRASRDRRKRPPSTRFQTGTLSLVLHYLSRPGFPRRWLRCAPPWLRIVPRKAAGLFSTEELTPPPGRPLRSLAKSLSPPGRQAPRQ